MRNSTRLKDLYERQRRALTRRPALGWSGGRSRIRLLDDGRCEVEQGDWRTPVAEPPEGGEVGGLPTPDRLMRASIGACLAMGYRLWGARLGVEIEEVEIDLLSVADARGRLNIGHGTPIGWQRLVVAARVTCAAPEAEIARVAAIAHRFSPMLANLGPSVGLRFQLAVRLPAPRPDRRE